MRLELAHTLNSCSRFATRTTLLIGNNFPWLRNSFACILLCSDDSNFSFLLALQPLLGKASLLAKTLWQMQRRLWGEEKLMDRIIYQIFSLLYIGKKHPKLAACLATLQGCCNYIKPVKSPSRLAERGVRFSFQLETIVLSSLFMYKLSEYIFVFSWLDRPDALVATWTWHSLLNAFLASFRFQVMWI